MPTLPEVLDAVVADLASGDGPVRLTTHLDQLDQEQRKAARAWFERSRAWFDGFRERSYRSGGLEVWREAPWLEGLCALALLPPAAAARRVPWQEMSPDGEETATRRLFAERLGDHDRPWVSTFVEIAGSTRLGAGPRRAGAGSALSSALRAAVVRHALPCPTGATFLQSWQAGHRVTRPTPRSTWPTKDDARTALADALVGDPLMPEILDLYLGSGHAGDEPHLPEVLADLVASGVTERTRVLQAILDALTHPPRVGTQRVLAGCLAALEVSADDVPGGAAYLVGTIATAHGSVGSALLPAAIASLRSPDELHELAMVIGSRPERRQKKDLLRALDATMADRVGRDATIRAVRTLGEGDPDSAFADDVRRALAGLGGGVDAGDDLGGSPRLGLWELRPEATRATPWLPPPSGPRFASSWPEQEADVVAGILTMLAEAPSRAPGVASWLDAMLTTGSVSLGNATRTVETLFLGGGMRLLWDHLVVLADKLAGEPRRPRGLEQLVRLLAGHAHEAPPRDVTDLTHLRAVASTGGERGASKLAVEARALLLAMSRAEELPPAVAASPPGPAPDRGLWDRRPSRPSRAVAVTRLAPFRERDLARLRDLLEADRAHADGPHTAPLVAPGGLVAGSHLLACVTDAIDHHGPERVATALAGIDRTVASSWSNERHPRPAGPVGHAIDLWVAGRLDASRYRELAHTTGSPEPADDLPHAPGRASVLVYLHAVETLLRAGRRGAVLLSSPTHSDGTLDVPTLMARMEDARDAGPLDLLLALLRLAPYDGAPPPVPELSFDPDLSPRVPGAADASALVERWLAAGGLPDPVARLEDARWQLDWRPPVPWREFAVVAAEGPTGPPLWTRHGGYDPVWRARTCPRWPDVVPHAAQESETDLRAVLALSGPLGEPSILLLLNVLARGRGEPFWKPGETDHDVLVDALTSGRIDPGRAAAAASLGWSSGAFSLPDGLPHWRRLLEDGAMAPFWPVALAVAEAGITHAPKPRGLADLLRLLADLAPEVPAGHRAVPAGVTRFAAGPGRTKSHDEARRLVAVLDRES